MATSKKESAPSPLTPIQGNPLEKIIGAVSRLDVDDLQRHGAWQDLDALSSQTIFDGIEANPDGVFKRGQDEFEAVGTVYVTLQYGDKRDRTAMSDSYPAHIHGKLDAGNGVRIDAITVDTSSFYE